MGKQYNKTIKRRRRLAYIERDKQKTKDAAAVASKPKAKKAPAPKKAPAAPAAPAPADVATPAVNAPEGNPGEFATPTEG